MRTPKKIILKKKSRVVQPKPKVDYKARLRATMRQAVKDLTSHMNRLGFTPESMASELGISVDKFQSYMVNPMRMDLRFIAHLESIIKTDLIVVPMYPQGYYGREQEIKRQKALETNSGFGAYLYSA